MTVEITPPSNVGYGTVVWDAISDVTDGPDANQTPDYIAPTGTISFVRTANILRNAGASPRPVSILSDVYLGVMNAEGRLCTPDAAAEPDYPGVKLIANDDPDLNPTGTKYIVSYNLKGKNGRPLDVPSHEIVVLEGETVDLTLVGPVDDAEEIGIPQAEALAAAAAASAATAAGALTEALTTFVRFRDTDGEPITGGVVTITVNTGTGEIDDIVYEEI